MRNRCGQFDVTHTFTAHFGQGNFNTTFLADDTAILHALIFTAKTFVITNGAENTRTEKTVFFRLERTVIDRFRLLDFTE